jgi:MFS family permease
MKDSKIFYGWYVVAACFAATFTLGEAMWSFGVFFKPLQAEFGWSRALVSSGYTAFLFGFAISSIISGRLADRYSPRPILFVSGLLAGVGVSMCSQVGGINELRFFLFIGGLGAGATISVPTSVVQRWFFGRPHAALAVGIVMAGVGAGALFFTPLTNFLVIGYGWRNAYLITGILFMIIIVFSSIIIRPVPEENGFESKREECGEPFMAVGGLTTVEIIKNHSFMGITFIHCSVAAAFQVISVHIIPYATDEGLSPSIAAIALGLLGGFSVPGRIISGYVADRTGWRKILAVCLFGMTLFIFWLFFIRAIWVLFCFVFFYGICHGSRISSHIGVLGEFFGMRSLGEIIGITMAIGQIFGALAPYLAGFIFDVTDSYVAAFMIVMITLLISGIIALVIKNPLAAEQRKRS